MWIFLLGVFGLKKQQLGGQKAGAVILDRTGDEDQPFLEQARIDVEGALAAGGLFDHHRHQGVVVEFRRIGHEAAPLDS
jgi:hypothetical protein